MLRCGQKSSRCVDDLCCGSNEGLISKDSTDRRGFEWRRRTLRFVSRGLLFG